MTNMKIQIKILKKMNRYYAFDCSISKLTIKDYLHFKIIKGEIDIFYGGDLQRRLNKWFQV